MDEIIKLDRMTVEVLRRLPFDTPTTFQMRDARACTTARALASIQQYYYGCKLSTSINMRKALITITKTHLPIRSERLKEHYGYRVQSRLYEMCNYYEIKGKDRRKR